MNKILLSLLISVALVGCAATEYKNARAKANEVQNGMTVAQASALLGLAPTHQGTDFVEWRRGAARKYDATASGAIHFDLRDGKIVNVPPGGIFGEIARKEFNAKWLAARQAEDEARRLADEKAEKEAARKLVAEAKARTENAEEERRLAAEAKREIAAEALAKADANYTCPDKTMCGKVFSLAQIYLAESADQKIQVVTDTIVQTYNPTEPANVGMTIVKVPGKGTKEVVQITASCKDNDIHSFASICRTKRTAIYRGFRPFIEARLQK
jgi:hypothetical protein